MNANSDRILKIVATIGFVLITLSLISIKNNPAIGYEISIYTALPSFVWIFLIGSIACGISIIVQQAFTQGDEKQNWWLIGLLLIMLSNLTILTLPFLRGYVTYGRWDVLTHVGLVLDILQNGFIGANNIYPVSHIFIAEISYMANIPVTVTIAYIVPFFVLLFVLFIYLLATVTINERQKIILATMASTVLLLSYTNYQVIPTALSAFAIPLVLYLYFKILEKKSAEFKICFILLIILYPFFHPLTSLVLIVAFISMELSKLCFDFIFKYKHGDITFISLNKVSLNPPLISSIIFIMWLSSHYSFWNNNMREVIKWFRGEATTTVISGGILNVFKRLNLQLLDIVELYLKSYSHISIFLVFSLIASIIIIRSVLISSNRNMKNLFVLLAWFILTSSLILVNLFKTVLEFGIWRLIAFMTVILPIFVGFALSELFIKKFSFKRRGIFLSAFFIIIILLIPSIVGIFNTYPSPWTLQANQQVTQMEMAGMKWYYECKNQTIAEQHIRSGFRFADSLLGCGERKRRGDIPNVERADTKIGYELPPGLAPPHFSYTEYKNIGNSLTENTYIPVSKYDEVFYTEMYTQLEIFTKSDFEKLNCDPTVDKLYSNSELEVWLVHATKPP